MEKTKHIAPAEDYAEDIVSKYLDSSILLTKEELYSYLYWAFCNGMDEQKKEDVNKILFG